MNGTGGLRYGRYVVGGISEWLLRIGPEDGEPILFIPPLFEEMNRTRAFTLAMMRRLAAEGFACWLPDLPGTGESERALESCRWEDWIEAVRTVHDQAISATGRVVIASLRGGALLADFPKAKHWRLAPVAGAALLRDLGRSSLVGGNSHAGYDVPTSISSALADAEPAADSSFRTVRLASDPKPADLKLEGPALWRRSEPASPIELAQLSAYDIAMLARR